MGTQNDSTTKAVTDLANQLQIQLEGIAGVASITGETTDEPALAGVLDVIEREVRTVRDGLDWIIEAASTGKELADSKAPLGTFDAIQARCEAMPIDQVALELRRYNWDASENLSATMEEDGYTVTRTWTRKGLRYFLAEREFLQELTEPNETEVGASDSAIERDGVLNKPERFAIPELLSERRADQDGWVHDVYMAAQDHAKHLRKAEGRLAKAKGLAETLRCALRSDDYDPEPFADDIAGSIVALLGKVQEQIDRHSREHSNLFLAYFDRDRH